LDPGPQAGIDPRNAWGPWEILTVAPGPTLSATPEIRVVDAAALPIGAIVAIGSLDGEGECNFDGSTELSLSVGADEAPKWASFQIDSKCNITLSAFWEGPLETGPKVVVGSLADVLTHETKSIEEGGGDPKASDATALAVCHHIKTSSQHVYMYGLGGTGDQLTHKNGSITFCWDFENVWIQSSSATCSGAQEPAWTWVVDSCTRIAYTPGPTDTQVRRKGQGNYHCDPPGQLPCSLSTPDGYFHHLFDEEIGKPNGTSTCIASFEGTIVSGVNREILQGCV
jgi:hypothetical protein